jgi:hypothetical protein
MMCVVAVIAVACAGPNAHDESSITAPADAKVSASTGSGALTADHNPLRNAYFGETHMHTSYSLDAYLGGTRLTPSDAYRFAKSQPVTVDGKPHQRKRPLDFVAVTDHAEYMGEMYSTMVEGAPGHDQELLEQLRTMTDIEDRQKWFLKYVISSNRSATPQHPPFFTTTRAGSQPSSPSSGAVLPAAPISTAMSSSATIMCPTPRSATSTSTARTAFGSGWPASRRAV